MTADTIPICACGGSTATVHEDGSFTCSSCGAPVDHGVYTVPPVSSADWVAVQQGIKRLRQQLADRSWRCFHCDKVFTDEKEAAEHFGADRYNPRPAWCEGMLSAIAETFELYGIHSNHHNAASVHRLADLYKDENERLRQQLDTAISDLSDSSAHIGELNRSIEHYHQAHERLSDRITDLERKLGEARRETLQEVLNRFRRIDSIHGPGFRIVIKEMMNAPAKDGQGREEVQ